jgi:O-antigen/teichoic acid export membrane protein
LTDLLIRTTEQVALPTFSRVQHDPKRVKEAFYQATQFIGLLAFPVFIASAVLAPEIVKIFFGSAWQESIPVMQVLAFIGIVHSISFLNGTVVVAMGKPSWKLKLNFVNALANVTGFLLVVKWGIVAVALAYTVRGALILPVTVLLVHKLINIEFKRYLYQYFICILSSILMVMSILAIKFFLGDTSYVPLVAAICVLFGTVTYVMAVFLINPTLFRKLVSSLMASLPPKKAGS